MPRRQPKAAIERRERELLRHYARVWQRVEQLQESIADDPARWRQRAKLTEARHAIERELDALDARAQAWFSNEFPAIHAMGVNAGAAEIGVSAATAWANIPTDVVATMASEGFGDLLKSTRTVRRTTKSMIRAIMEDEIMDKLIRGDTAKAAARRARKIIERRGVHAVRYKDGSLHGLREYANMAVRTKTAVAYNLGSLQAQESQGIKHWEIMDGVGCVWPTGHGAGIPAQGQVVTRGDALMYPIAHPNCRRAFAARPDLDPAPYLREIQEPDVRVPTEKLRERARQRTEERVSKLGAWSRWEANRSTVVRKADRTKLSQAERTHAYAQENLARERGYLAEADERVKENLARLKRYVPDAKERAKAARTDYSLKEAKRYQKEMRKRVAEAETYARNAARELESAASDPLPDFNPDNPLEFYGDRLTIYDRSSSTLKHLTELEEDVAQHHHELLRDHYAETPGGGFFVGDRYITDLDDLGHLKGEKPRGWTPGSTFDQVPGVYDPGRRVCACGGDGKGHGSTSLVLHEGGHALDEAYGTQNVKGTRSLASERQDYLDAVDAVPESVRARWNPYYRPDGNPTGHRSEAWAEGFAAWTKVRRLPDREQARAMAKAMIGVDDPAQVTIDAHLPLAAYYRSLQ